MASTLLTLLDDIATLLDDIAVLTKVAAQKTAGVLGDDLALNAQQVSGIDADRELPVVWAVAKGSFINKAILVPLALLLSLFAPKLITPLLMLGGAYLCYEGFEKIAHKFLHPKAEDDVRHQQELAAFLDQDVDLVAFEKKQIKGAVRTDFILSAEIIVLALGSFGDVSFLKMAISLTVIAILMTIGVYGIVALIVKIDDFGLYLNRKKNHFVKKIGDGLVVAAPMLMKILTILGTAAMFLVGGGIFTHNIAFLHHIAVQIVQTVGAWGSIASVAFDGGVGIVVGGVAVLVVSLATKVYHALSR